MNRDRLTHMITVLEAVRDQKKNFDLNHFATNVVDGEVEEVFCRDTGPVINEPCGTACCAVGYAAMDPYFMKLGLRLQFTPIGSIYPELYDPKVHGSVIQINTSFPAIPVYELGDHAWDTVCDFFDISEDTADYLFFSESYGDNEVTTPDMVIERIKGVLNASA